MSLLQDYIDKFTDIASGLFRNQTSNAIRAQFYRELTEENVNTFTPQQSFLATGTSPDFVVDVIPNLSEITLDTANVAFYVRFATNTGSGGVTIDVDGAGAANVNIDGVQAQISEIDTGVTYLMVKNGSAFDIIGGAGGGGGASDLNGLSDVTITTPTRGDILYRNATEWVNLGAGTDGQVLRTRGASNDPVWVDASLLGVLALGAITGSTNVTLEPDDSRITCSLSDSTVTLTNVTGAVVGKTYKLEITNTSTLFPYEITLDPTYFDLNDGVEFQLKALNGSIDYIELYAISTTKFQIVDITYGA